MASGVFYSKTEVDTLRTGDAAAVAATYAPFREPLVALLGDSITDLNNYPGGRNTSAGFFSVANVILGHRLERIAPTAGMTIYNQDGSVVAPSALPDKNFATPGYRTDQIIAAGYPAAAAASAAKIVVVLAGTNDAEASMVPSDIITRLQTIWATLTAAGKTVVACTIPPMDASRATATGIARDVNTLIRETAPRTPGVILCDWANAILDPSTDAIGANYSGDGVHPVMAGGFRLGTQLAAVLAGLIPAPAITPWLPQDSGGSRSLTADPFGVSAVTVGWDFSGNTWCRFDQGSPTSVTVSKIARADAVPGNWTQVQVVAANPLTDGTRLFIFANTGGKITDGTTKVRFVAEFQTDSAGLDCRSFSADCYMDPVGASTTDLWYDTTTSRSPVGLLLPRSGVLLTPPIVVPGGTNHVQGWVDFYGSGTFRIGRMGVIAVD